LVSPKTLTALHVKGGKGLAQITAHFAKYLFRQIDTLTESTQEKVAVTFCFTPHKFTERNGFEITSRDTKQRHPIIED